jgi:hypothetical protein
MWLLQGAGLIDQRVAQILLAKHTADPSATSLAAQSDAEEYPGVNPL